jgi:hypothetical protein
MKAEDLEWEVVEQCFENGQPAAGRRLYKCATEMLASRS